MAPVPPLPPPPPPQAPRVGAVVPATATMANGGCLVDADVEAAAAATTAVATVLWTVLVSDAHAAAGAHWDVFIDRLLRWWCREVQGGTLLVDAWVVAPVAAAKIKEKFSAACAAPATALPPSRPMCPRHPRQCSTCRRLVKKKERSVRFGWAVCVNF